MSVGEENFRPTVNRGVPRVRHKFAVGRVRQVFIWCWINDVNDRETARNPSFFRRLTGDASFSSMRVTISTIGISDPVFGRSGSIN